jgi:sulfate adenylyltransferase large subunit/thioredoxin-dependent adenylylsulfate APS reductase
MSAASELAWLRNDEQDEEQKDLLRFVTIGSVDDGKSTLIGRLLHDANGLYQDQLDAVRRASARGSTRGHGSVHEIDFSLVTDGLLAEREQGITIDVAYRYFATARRKFIIADTPGHVQYTRNMATGASTADVAVILVDARYGVLPQTRRHAHVAALLGIKDVIACVNKMDLVDFDDARFAAIGGDLDLIGRKLGITLHVLPVSALAGDNVVHPSERMPWWTGGTLLDRLETIETLQTTGAAGAQPFRFPVQLVLRPGLGYRAFAGQIASGQIANGTEVIALPSGKRTKIVGVDLAGSDVGTAAAPMSVALRIADELDLSRGDMLVSAVDAPRSASVFDAKVVWMSERALDPDKTYLLKHTTRTVRADLSVLSGTDPETLEPTPAETMGLNDIGLVRVHARSPLSFDPYLENRATGAFIVIDSLTNDTVAAGMIVREEAVTKAAPPEEALALALSRYERVAIAFSGAEDVILIDMATRIRSDVSVFFLDTGRLHPETYRFLERVRERYGVRIEALFPDPQLVESLVREKGLYSFRNDGHGECCGIRKVAPLRRKLATLDAWVTGQRRDQSPGTRSNVAVIEEDATFGSLERPLVKINPLATWTSERVWAYIRRENVPYNELHERGFVSIGCEPCTRPILPGQHEREGRWWWEEAMKKECGLHPAREAP